MNLPTMFLLLMVGAVVGLSFQVFADETTQMPNLKFVNYMFDFAGRGFDVRTQNLHNITKNPLTWSYHVYFPFKFKPDEKNWTDPKYPDSPFKVPNYVEDIKILPNQKTKINVFDNFANLEPLLSPNSSTMQIPENFKNQANATALMGVLAAESIATQSRIKFDVNDGIEPTIKFKSAISSLINGVFKDNQKLYDDFFYKYGTHYIRSIEFGGILRQKSGIDAKYYHNDLKRDAALVEKYLQQHLDHTLDNSKADAPPDFLKQTKFETFLVGGDQSKTDDIKAWIDSIDSHRMPVQVTLEPFYQHPHLVTNLGIKGLVEFRLAFDTTMLKYELTQCKDLMWEFNASNNKWGRLRNLYPAVVAGFFQDYLDRNGTVVKFNTDGLKYPIRDHNYTTFIYQFMKQDVDFFADLRINGIQ